MRFRLAKRTDKQAVLDFLHTHWDVQDAFVNQPAFFHYYFEDEDGGLRFVLAELNGEMAALAGYIPAARRPGADIWVSIWVANPAMPGAGLALMEAIPSLTGCGCMACNNIRPKTRVFYEFLGFTAGRVGHFYRLADKENYQIARVGKKEILPVAGGLSLRRLPDETALRQSGFTPPPANPQKDLWYIARRYFAFPGQRYELYACCEVGGETPLALLAVRVIEAGGTAVLRLADYIGDESLLPRLGQAIDGLMREKEAEYADFYCVGLSAEALRAAGFSERAEGDDTNILPNYLEPPLYENTDYYYFTTKPEGFRLCKADGDQDRPRKA